MEQRRKRQPSLFHLAMRLELCVLYLSSVTIAGSQAILRPVTKHSNAEIQWLLNCKFQDLGDSSVCEELALQAWGTECKPKQENLRWTVSEEGQPRASSGLCIHPPTDACSHTKKALIMVLFKTHYWKNPTGLSDSISNFYMIKMTSMPNNWNMSKWYFFLKGFHKTAHLSFPDSLYNKCIHVHRCRPIWCTYPPIPCLPVIYHPPTYYLLSTYRSINLSSTPCHLSPACLCLSKNSTRGGIPSQFSSAADAIGKELSRRDADMYVQRCK